MADLGPSPTGEGGEFEDARGAVSTGAGIRASMRYTPERHGSTEPSCRSLLGVELEPLDHVAGVLVVIVLVLVDDIRLLVPRLAV